MDNFMKCIMASFSMCKLYDDIRVLMFINNEIHYDEFNNVCQEMEAILRREHKLYKKCFNNYNICNPLDVRKYVDSLNLKMDDNLKMDVINRITNKIAYFSRGDDASDLTISDYINSKTTCEVLKRMESIIENTTSDNENDRIFRQDLILVFNQLKLFLLESYSLLEIHCLPYGLNFGEIPLISHPELDDAMGEIYRTCAKTSFINTIKETIDDVYFTSDDKQDCNNVVKLLFNNTRVEVLIQYLDINGLREIIGYYLDKKSDTIASKNLERILYKRKEELK